MPGKIDYSHARHVLARRLDDKQKGAVQDTSKGYTDWTELEDDLLSTHRELTSIVLGRLAHKLHRPPDAVRMRHAHLMQKLVEQNERSKRREMLAATLRRKKEKQ
jgi:hypothetical protein